MGLNGKHIMITGGTGFIGSRLVERFLEMESPTSVTTLVRSASDLPASGDRIARVVGNLLDRKSLRFDHDFDAVYHLAALKPLERNTRKLRNVNYGGTVNLFDSVKDKTRSFIYVSGTAIFSQRSEEGTVIDEDSPRETDTEYVRIRLETEQFLRDRCKDCGIDLAIVYLPDIVYGNRGYFRSMFLERIRDGRFRIPGNGAYVKPLIHLDDAVNFLIRILEVDMVRDSYIVTDSNPAPFRDFVNEIADLLKVRRPSAVPALLAQIVLGKELTRMLTRSTTGKMSNSKMKKIYELRYPSYREGLVDVVSEFKSLPRRAGHEY